VLGSVAAAEGNFESALRELALAEGEALPAGLRAKAKFARARVEIDTGDSKAASADLEAVRALDSGSAGKHASLLLEALAIDAGDRAKAETLARELKSDREVGAAAQSLLRK